MAHPSIYTVSAQYLHYLVCEVGVQSSDDPALLLGPGQEGGQVLAARGHLHAQVGVGLLTVDT